LELLSGKQAASERKPIFARGWNLTSTVGRAAAAPAWRKCLTPCSFRWISRISSHPAVFFSHNKLANSTFRHNKPAKRTECKFARAKKKMNNKYRCHVINSIKHRVINSVQQWQKPSRASNLLVVER
jgi:hypothetical protein